MERAGFYFDPDVNAALDWLAEVSGDPSAFRSRIENTQSRYRQYVGAEANLGKDPKIDGSGVDRVVS